MMLITIGTTGHAETTVTRELTALETGSGSLLVFATPHMAGMMEQAAWTAVQPFLEEGKTTVGTSLTLRHTAATPVGMTVRAEAEVTAVDGKKLVFAVRAYDESGEIGSGTHERVIVTEESFLERTYAKLEEVTPEDEDDEDDEE